MAESGIDVKPRISIIGAGKVGTVLARLSVQAGYRVTAVFSRRSDSAERLASSLDARAVSSLHEASDLADLILLTVPDDAVGETAGELARSSVRGKAVVHTAGALDASVLETLARVGAQVGSWHPAHAFASVDVSEGTLNRVAFAIEAYDEPLRQWLLELTHALGGLPLFIPPGGKAVYHAALVFVSNYTVTLYAVAQQLMADLGFDREAASLALNPLLSGTATNLLRQGVPLALTGPLVRGDGRTLTAHLNVLDAQHPEFGTLYRELARATLPVAIAQQPDRDYGPIATIVDERKNHAN